MAGQPARERVTDPVVVWVSGAFGYAGELLYFEDIFRGFAASFARAVVPVASDFPVERYPGLPLRPMMRFARLGRMRRQVRGIEYHSIRRFPTPASLWRIARLRPAAMLLTEFSFVSLACFVTAKLVRSKTVILVESDPGYRGAPPSRLARAVKAAVARSADAVLVSNESGARYLTGTLGVERSKLTIGPYLTSDPAGPPPTPTAGRTGPVRFLFLNSVTRRKGVEELLRAFALADPTVSRSWRLDVFGSGDYEEAARALAAELGLADNVVFHGRVAYRSAGNCYRDCDVVVSPTLADYRSLSGFEAVNAGRPLLISLHDGASDELARLAPAVNVVDPSDIRGFAEALRPLLIRSAALAAQQAAAMRLPEQFTMASVVRNVRDVVNRVLQRTAAG